MICGHLSAGRLPRLQVVFFALVAVALFAVSPAFADQYTNYYEPVLLTSYGAPGNVEVVLQVSPGVAPGPYEYVYWVTNNTSTEMHDFYLTCVGSADTAVFDPMSFRVMDGYRNVTPGGVEFYWGADNYDWGNLLIGQAMMPHMDHKLYYDEITETLLASTKFRWTSDGLGLAPGESLGFSFINIYGPELYAGSIAAAMAIHNYNEYVYGPGTEPDIPEWPALTMALSGFGFVGVLKRRFLRS